MWHDQGKWVACRKMSIPCFVRYFLITSQCFILMQTPFKLDIWLQSYAGFDTAKNKRKQRHLNPVFANISKTISPISDLFPLDHVTYSYRLLLSGDAFLWCNRAINDKSFVGKIDSEIRPVIKSFCCIFTVFSRIWIELNLILLWNCDVVFIKTKFLLCLIWKNVKIRY